MTIHRKPTTKPATNAVATQQQASAPARQSTQADPVVQAFRAELRERQANIASCLGQERDSPTTKRYMAQFVRLVMANPKLLDPRPATRQTLMLAFGEAAALGLSINPQEGQAYLIPRWSSKIGANIVDLQLGYRGMLQLAYRSGQVDSIEAVVVYKGEHYVRRCGTINPGIEHFPDDVGSKRTGKMDDIVCAYATARLRGATGLIYATITKRQIEEARAMSGGKGGTSPVWAEHTEAMVAKTAIRRVCKLLPSGDGLAALHGAIAREAEREAGMTVYAAGARSVAMPRAQPMAGLEALAADPFDTHESLDSMAFDLPRDEHGSGQGEDHGGDQVDEDQAQHDEALAQGAEAFAQFEQGEP